MRYLKMLESGIDPATVRFEVGVKIGNKCYCKYSVLEARRSAVIKESSMSAFEWSDIRRDGCEFADCITAETVA